MRCLQITVVPAGIIWMLALGPVSGQTIGDHYVKKDSARATFEASVAAAEQDAVRPGPWHWIGPFDVETPKDLAKALETSSPIGNPLDLTARSPGRGGKEVAWQKLDALRDGQLNDLSSTVKEVPCTVYLARTIESTGDYELPLQLGNSAPTALWINGNRILADRGAPQARLSEKNQRKPLSLRKGKNDLVVKIVQGEGEAAFGFALGSLAGTLTFQDALLAKVQADSDAAEFRQLLIELDWDRQWTQLEAQVRDRARFEKLVQEMVRPDAGIAEDDRDPADVVLRRTAALMDDMAALDRHAGLKPAPERRARAKQVLVAARPQLEQLKAASAKTDIAAVAARKAIYLSACRLRRGVALANPLLDFDQLLFIKRELNGPSEGVGHHCCDQFFGFNARNIPGGGVYVLEAPFGESPVLKNLLADAAVQNGPAAGKKLNFGAFLSPEVSYDAKMVLFAHSRTAGNQRWSEERSYHIFAVGADGQDLRQLTEGAWNDFDPCFLPDGRIVFISERRGGFGRCHGRPVPAYTLHTMNADGSDIQCISFHESNEWQPSVNHDGMIVYTRWDYVDRAACIVHHPWITAPDGRDARAVHGNYPPSDDWPHRPQMEMDIRAIPGSRKYVATAAAHHGQAYGSLVIFDPRELDDGAMGPVRRLTPDALFPESEISQNYPFSEPYATAWPLSEDYHLCVWDPASRNYGIYLLDSFGNKELIYRAPGISCLSPLPFVPRRRAPVVPTLAMPAPPTGTQPVAAMAPKPGDKPAGRADKKDLPFYSVHDPDRGWSKRYNPLPGPEELGEVVVLNVYDGQQPWPEGTQIKQLRIVQTLIKSTPGGNSPPIGVDGLAAARAVLGTVPVEADGSARFLAPIHRPLYFQAIDQNGLAVQSMRSDTYLMRSARLTCTGCHEPSQRATPARAADILALQRLPSKIAPDVDGTNPFNYPRLVQPVLERHCVECHRKSAPNNPKAIDLSRGTDEDNVKRGGWYASYSNLASKYGYRNIGGYDSRNGPITGSITLPGKFGAYPSKLYTLLKAGHHDVKLPPEDMHRLTLWLETNSAFYGDYHDTAAQARGEVVRPVVE